MGTETIIYGGIIDGASLSWTPQGLAFTEKYVVENVEGDTIAQKFIYAKNSLGIFPGLQHSEFTDCFIQDAKFDLLTSNTVQVVLTYEQMINLPDEITISGALQNVQTNKDYNNDVIEVEYTYASTYNLDPNKAGKTDTVVKQVDKQVPTLAVAIKTRELTTGTDLLTRAQTYIGKLNSQTWYGDAAKTWICKGIEPIKAGVVYQNNKYQWVYDITYNFEWSDNWSVDVVFVNPDTGEPPEESTWGENTQKTVQLYSTIDFNNIQSNAFYFDEIEMPDLG